LRIDSVLAFRKFLCQHSKARAFRLEHCGRAYEHAG
jgi:hypothetical protein